MAKMLKGGANACTNQQFYFTHPPTTNFILPWTKTTKVVKKTPSKWESTIEHSARNVREEKKDNERKKKKMVIKQLSKGENKILNFMVFLFIDPFKIWYYHRHCSKSEHPTTNKLYSLRSLGIILRVERIYDLWLRLICFCLNLIAKCATTTKKNETRSKHNNDAFGWWTEHYFTCWTKFESSFQIAQGIFCSYCHLQTLVKLKCTWNIFEWNVVNHL